MLLSLAGGAFGFLVARWTTYYLLRFAPDEQARLVISPEIAPRILGLPIVLIAEQPSGRIRIYG